LVRNAVASRLSGGTYARDLVVKSVYQQTNPLSTNDVTKADVHVRAVVAEGPDRVTIAPSRGADYYTVAVEMIVVGAVANKEVGAVDALLEVAEQVQDRLRSASGARLTLAGGGTAQYLRSDINPMADPATVEEQLYAVFSVVAYYVLQSPRPA
jgi:ethanolamine ammonia-lyase large subunit